MRTSHPLRVSAATRWLGAHADKSVNSFHGYGVVAPVPAEPKASSLNLAQAVLLFCYELQQGLREKGERKKRALAKTGEMEGMFGQMEQVLAGIGFLNPQNPEHQMHALRSIFNRAELDEKEVHILRGIFSQVEWAKSRRE